VTRILFVADGRSPITLNWIRYFITGDHEVHLASSFPCQLEPGLASFSVVPVALSEMKEAGKSGAGEGKRDLLLRKLVPLGLRTRMRQWLGPLTLPKAAQHLRDEIQNIQPDLVHAMRIPYEGMLASLAMREMSIPLLVSVWGNDFTLHAPSTPWMRRYTRLTLQAADALHTDCQRDQRLARVWGFASQRPGIVLPGGGGIQLDVFHPAESALARPPIVINPRGLRAYARSDTFFKAAALVAKQRPEVRFPCPGMAGQAEALRWVRILRLDSVVQLLPALTRPEIADLFRQAQVMLSITTHDGTPNALLEALASGCFPIAGDLESIREWITPGVNGLLVDPGDPQALAEAILRALDQPELRAEAKRVNLELVRERAEYNLVMHQAKKFYITLISKNI